MSSSSLTGARLRGLAGRHGTPLHVLDLADVRARLEELRGAGRGRGFDRVRYAQKANPNLSLLRHLRAAGACVDAVSAGELERARRAGFAPRDVNYCADQFDHAALEGLAGFPASLTIGSADMLEPIAERGLAGSVCVRVNPGLGRGHHAKVTTGGSRSKHGVWHADLARTVARARELGLRVGGLHVHVGSGAAVQPEEELQDLLQRLAAVVGPQLESISAGGGLPVPYRPQDPPLDLDLLADTWDALRARVEAELGREVVLEVEPGRYLVARAGVLLSEVRGRKRSPDADYILVDAGFNDLVRPALYGAHHRISVLGRERDPTAPRLVAGPLCENGDVFTVDGAGEPSPRPLPDARPGDLVCLHDTGAYGAAMSSTYNSRPLAAEVFVDGPSEHLARRRQTLDELFAPEESLDTADTESHT